MKITVSSNVTRGASTTSTTNTSPAVAQGCITLFALPFAGVGVFTAFQAIKLATEGKLAQAAPLGAFGAIFGTVGFGLIIGGFKARKTLAAKQARQDAAPDKPWLWREDWASRLIPDSSKAGAIGLWVFAIFWNLIALPSTYLALKQGITAENKAAWLIFLFPIVGLGLLAAATYSALRARRYGVSVLELVAVPIPLGREIAGRIHVPGVFEPEQGIRVTLTCGRQVTTGSGKSRSTTTTILWQDDLTIPGVLRDASGVAIPFAMAVPADQPESDDRNSNNKIIWKVSAAAAVAGIDYSADFEVPVFHTAESDTAPPPEMAEREKAQLTAYTLPPDAPVSVVESGRGVDISFPMGRNAGVAAGLTLFALLWSVVVYIMFQTNAPWLFRIVFALTDLLLLAIATGLWLGHSELHADSTGLTINSGVGPFSRSRRFAANEVTSVRPKVGMTSGNRAYFDLHLVFRDGSELIAGRGLRDPRQAEWVGSKLLSALGKQNGGDSKQETGDRR
ncbi:MAG TPA: hypothetical protein VMJ30_05725 [Gemmatimonadales bacterium]|nr:hypothetical protein [Gemmatimonadales bacterium]